MEELLQRIRTRGNDTPEKAASIKYLKGVYDRSVILEKDCKYVVDLSQVSITCAVQKVLAIINSQTKLF